VEQSTELSPINTPADPKPGHKVKGKPGRKPGPDKIAILEARIEMLERCVERVTTLTGNGNILRAFGLSRWLPGKKDLSKYSN